MPCFFENLGLGLLMDLRSAQNNCNKGYIYQLSHFHQSKKKDGKLQMHLCIFFDQQAFFCHDHMSLLSASSNPSYRQLSKVCR